MLQKHGWDRVKPKLQKKNSFGKYDSSGKVKQICKTNLWKYEDIGESSYCSHNSKTSILGTPRLLWWLKLFG